MKITMKHLRVVEALLRTDARTARIFVSPTIVVRATRRIYRKARSSKSMPIEMCVSITRPNYIEREMIRRGRKDPKRFEFGVVMIDYRK